MKLFKDNILKQIIIKDYRGKINSLNEKILNKKRIRNNKNIVINKNSIYLPLTNNNLMETWAKDRLISIILKSYFNLKLATELLNFNSNSNTKSLSLSNNHDKIDIILELENKNKNIDINKVIKYTYYNILMSVPIFKHTNDITSIIIFLYMPNNYNNNGGGPLPLAAPFNNLLFNHLIDELLPNKDKSNKNIDKWKVTNIFENIYDKTINIEPIVIKYGYNDPTILLNKVNRKIIRSNNIVSPIGPWPTNRKIRSKKMIINLLNMKLIDNNNLNKWIINNKELINHILLYNDIYDISLENYKTLYYKSYNELDKDIILNLLSNKYLIGYSHKFNGKIGIKTNKSSHISKVNGKFNNTHINSLPIYYNNKPNIDNSNFNYLSAKNGQYNSKSGGLFNININLAYA